MSKDDLLKSVSGFIPVESNISSNAQDKSENDLYNSRGGEMKRSNLSNIEVDQLKNIITSNMKYYG